MKFFNDKISVRQLQVLLILDIFGTGVIVMPRIAASIAGENGWLVAIFAMFRLHTFDTSGTVLEARGFASRT